MEIVLSDGMGMRGPRVVRIKRLIKDDNSSKWFINGRSMLRGVPVVLGVLSLMGMLLVVLIGICMHRKMAPLFLHISLALLHTSLYPFLPTNQCCPSLRIPLADQTGSDATLNAVREKVTAFNVQLDNLCQFLPQDRVAAFASMRPHELLVETEKAIGNAQLHEQHMEMVQLQVAVREKAAVCVCVSLGWCVCVGWCMFLGGCACVVLRKVLD